MRLGLGWALPVVGAALVLGSTMSVSALEGQRGWGRRTPPRFPDAEAPRSPSFVFARVMYQSVRREYLGTGWTTDYPEGDHNFMSRFEELTSGSIARDGEGQPDFVVVRLTEDEVFDFPFLFMSDVGTVGFSTEEATRLREYLLRGGLLYVDDFWGERAWDHWVTEIGRVLSPTEFPIFDIPPDHALFHMLYQVPKVPQIPSIQYWRQSGGGSTSERGQESADPHLRGIADHDGRLLVVMSHNTDIADGWEREGEEWEFFYQFSSDAYALAINIVLYALTH